MADMVSQGINGDDAVPYGDASIHCGHLEGEQIEGAPLPTGLSGTFATGNTITVTGSNFGTDGIPVMFDDFEDAVLDADLTGRQTQGQGTKPWNTYKSSGPDRAPFVGSVSYSGSKAGHTDLSKQGDSLAYVTDWNHDRVYITFWQKKDYSHTSKLDYRIEKGFRPCSNINAPIMKGNPRTKIQEPSGPFSNASGTGLGSGPRFTVEMDSGSSGADTSLYFSADDFSTNGSWHRREYYMTVSTPNVADGMQRYWRDLQPVTLKNSGLSPDPGDGNPDLPFDLKLVTQVDGPNNYNTMCMPYYIDDSQGSGAGVHKYFDNVCMQTSLSRVEAGNSPIFENCTKREIMRTETRADGLITFTVPANTFNSGETVYIHVVNDNDEKGTPAAAGLSISAQ